MKFGSDFSRQRRAVIKLWLKLKWPLLGAVVLLGLIFAGRQAFEQYRQGSEEQRIADTSAVAQNLASTLGNTFSDILKTLAPVAKSKTLIAALQAERAAIASLEADLAKGHPNILRVRLLGSGPHAVDYEGQPPMGYAGLEMLRRSGAEEAAPLPEMHLFGSEGRHIAVLYRLKKADGSLAGHLLYALNAALLQQTLDAAPLSTGYTELRQRVTKGKALVLGKKGNTAARTPTADFRYPIPGTPWTLFYWTGVDTTTAPEETSSDLMPMLVAAVLVILILVALVVIRRKKKAQGLPVVGGGAAQFKNAKAAITEAEKLEPIVEKPAGPADLALEPGGGVEIDNQDEDKEMPKLPDAIFRAYDIRGVVGSDLTPDVVRQIGHAIGSEAYDRGQQTIVVARDGRLSGPELSEALVEGLRASGRDVIDVGRVPTPTLYFATYFLNTGSGVMVTGSHNPSNYNGLKIMLGGNTLFGDDIAALRQRLLGKNLVDGEGTLQHMEVADDYIRRITDDIPVVLGESLKIVIDAGNGVAGEIGPRLFRALGHDVVELYCEIDGDFPNHHPDPGQPENLKDLIQAVADNNADLGLAFDGDGDRLGIVDGNGTIIWPDRQMMLFARDVLSRNPGAEIVYDVKCSNRLESVIKKLAGKPVMWKTGHSFIKNKMKESGALLAGEMSGHIFFKERWYGFDDALYAGARMLEILIGLKKSPAEIFSLLPAGVSTPELHIDLKEGEQQGFMERLLAAVDMPDAKIIHIDGMRADFPDGWGLVRASNTTPCLVLRFEGDNQQALEQVQEKFRSLLLGLDDSLKLPF